MTGEGVRRWVAPSAVPSYEGLAGRLLHQPRARRWRRSPRGPILRLFLPSFVGYALGRLPGAAFLDQLLPNLPGGKLSRFPRAALGGQLLLHGLAGTFGQAQAFA